eukprot:3614860-Rhodomonas_salina.2
MVSVASKGGPVFTDVYHVPQLQHEFILVDWFNFGSQWLSEVKAARHAFHLSVHQGELLNWGVCHAHVEQLLN